MCISRRATWRPSLDIPKLPLYETTVGRSVQPEVADRLGGLPAPLRVAALALVVVDKFGGFLAR